MKIKRLGVYITKSVVDSEGEITEQPIEFTSAVYTKKSTVLLRDENEVTLLTLEGYSQSSYTLEGGDWTPEPPTQEEKEKADSDTFFLEITEGTISQQSKARLYARQVHEGKLTYPDDIPEDIRSDVYDAYTNHYKYQPTLAITTTLAEPYEVDEIQMVLTDGSQFPSEGTVTVSDSEHSTVIEFSDHKGNDLGGCRCIDGDKGVVYAVGSTVKLN